MKSAYFILLLILCSCNSTKQIFVACTDPLCPYCHGTGRSGVCVTCMGKGTMLCVQDDTGEQVLKTCEACNGSGERWCGEYVAVEKEKKLKIKNER